MNEHIPVFLASDNGYAPYVAVTIVSVMENTKSMVDFYVLDSAISEASKRKIKDSAKKFTNCHIEFISMNESVFTDLPECDVHISRAAYNRFLIPEIKPEFKKIIYSDVDVIFLGDIKDLYEEGLDGEIVGVVHDALFLISDNLYNYRNRLNLPESHNYFNSGLLLIDVEKWNNENITKKIMQLGVDKGDKCVLGDQDILNMYFGSNYKSLSVRYGATNAYILNAAKFDNKTRGDLQGNVIRHFEGPEKPWNSNSINGVPMPNVKEFWQYAVKTDFYSKKDLILAAAQRQVASFLELFYCPIL